MSGQTDRVIPGVALFATCLVDLFRPSVGFAAARLLERAGFTVHVPPQACCGQPAFNSGDEERARDVARAFVDTFSRYEYVVTPSGSCASMIRFDMPRLFDGASGPAALRALEVAEKTWELTAFLVESGGAEIIDAENRATVTYHDGCSGLRKLSIREQPRELLRAVRGLTLVEYEGAAQCCGFGGTFCVKFPELSTEMCHKRCAQIAESAADELIGGEMGCLMNLSGAMARQGQPIGARHVAEVLAGMTDTPALGRGKGSV